MSSKATTKNENQNNNNSRGGLFEVYEINLRSQDYMFSPKPAAAVAFIKDGNMARSGLNYFNYMRFSSGIISLDTNKIK